MAGFIIPLAVAGLSALFSGLQARRQNKKNRELAEFQADANERYQREQNQYNSPKMQMARFQEAGLNPNLIYSQGNPGNQSSSLTYPSQATPSVADLGSIMPMMNQTMMAQSQVSAQNAKTTQTHALTELNKLQAKLVASNPLLNNEGFKATIDSLVMTAQLKQTQWNQALTDLQTSQATQAGIVEKVNLEVANLVQRLGLNTQDKAIKAEILKSKEYNNAILEVQKNFMQNGNITPQHILQFIQILLLKLF